MFGITQILILTAVLMRAGVWGQLPDMGMLQDGMTLQEGSGVRGGAPLKPQQQGQTSVVNVSLNMNRQQQQPRPSPPTVLPPPVPIFPQPPRPVIRPSPPRPTPAIPRRPQRAVSVQIAEVGFLCLSLLPARRAQPSCSPSRHPLRALTSPPALVGVGCWFGEPVCCSLVMESGMMMVAKVAGGDTSTRHFLPHWGERYNCIPLGETLAGGRDGREQTLSQTNINNKRTKYPSIRQQQ
ncbi:hypothetical protein Pcinc_038499 [Petrolisthes cinctipes]|uniref:Uncharacterized protein n=1 Tax=Petrolisthes cinctipes TaxID=88211 RepID=A0AAE1EMY5_PETCI|nr:hypothetical protein Pcinc_038499 [Petrolisthes cinctipes]